MAKAVVDVLEAVEIDEQHRELVALVAGPAGQGALEPLLEEGAVRELGEVIVDGVVDEALVGGAQADAHLVERRGDGGRLGGAAYRHLQREIAGGDLLGRRGDVAQGTAQVTAEEHPADQRQRQRRHAGQREARPQRVDELLGERPVGQHQQPTRITARHPRQHRENRRDVLARPPGRRCRASRRARPSRPAAARRRRLRRPGQARRDDLVVDHERHLAARQPGQPGGHLVGELVADGQRADDLLADARRHRHDDEQPRPELHHRPGGAAAAGGVLGVAHDVAAAARRIVRAGAADPGAVGERAGW